MTHTNTTPLPRVFMPLSGANLLAQAAEQLSLAAVPMLAVLLLGAGATQIGLLGVAQTLPFLLLSIPLGLLADRRSRRRLMVAAELLRALCLLALAAATAAGGIGLPVLALLGFLGAAGTVAFTVAAPAAVPALVPQALWGRANGRLELARSVAYAAGPALGGAMVAATGAAPAFALAAAMSIVAVVLLAQLPALEPPLQASPAPRRAIASELHEGASFVRRHVLLWPMLQTAVLWNIAWFVLQAAYMPYALKTLGLSPRTVGFTLAAFGVGMVLGALLAPRLMQRLPIGQAIVIGPVVSVVAAVAILGSLVWPHAAWAALSFFLFGAGPIVWTVATTTLRQTVTPAAMLGRVGAIFLAANSGARPLGAALGAAIAWLVVGTEAEAACLLVSAALFVMQAALVLASPLPTHGTAKAPVD